MGKRHNPLDRDDLYSVRKKKEGCKTCGMHLCMCREYCGGCEHLFTEHIKVMGKDNPRCPTTHFSLKDSGLGRGGRTDKIVDPVTGRVVAAKEVLN